VTVSVRHIGESFIMTYWCLFQYDIFDSFSMTYW